jgi:hypothetical protein
METLGLVLCFLLPFSAVAILMFYGGIAVIENVIYEIKSLRERIRG